MYLFVLFILLSFCIIYEFCGKIKFNKYAYYGEYILLSLLSGFRYRIGYDTVVYATWYESFPDFMHFSFFEDYNTDIFWVAINSICKSIWDEFALVQLIQAFFVNGVLFWFIRKYSPRPFFTILLSIPTIWLQLNYEALREGFAVGFYLIALDAIFSNKNILKYYLRVWPALLFHSFGGVTFIWPFIHFIKITRKSILFVIILAVCIIVFSSDIMAVLTNYMLTSGYDVAIKMESYLNSDVYGTNIWTIYGLISIFIGNIIPLFIFLLSLNYGKSQEIAKRYMPYIVILIIITFFKIQMPIFFRFYNYFYAILLIVMAICIDKRLALPKWRLLSWCAIFMFMFITIFGLRSKMGEQYSAFYRYYPYNSIFTKDYNHKTEALIK